LVQDPAYFKNGTPKPPPGVRSRRAREVKSLLEYLDPPPKKPHPLKGKFHCQVCRHPEVKRMEMLYTGGMYLKDLAEQFGVHRDAVWQHMTKHMQPESKIAYLAGASAIADLTNKAAAENKSVLEYLQLMRSVLVRAFMAASDEKDVSGTAQAARPLIDVLRELGRLSGEISAFSAATINSVTTNNIVNHTQIVNSQTFIELQSGLLEVCQAHPEARRNIIALFQRLDEQHAEAPDPKRIEYDKRPEQQRRSEGIKAGIARKKANPDALTIADARALAPSRSEARKMEWARRHAGLDPMPNMKGSHGHG
jgi:hypothetical protein